MALRPAPDGVHRVFLGLGANLGDRAANIQHALAALKEKVTIRRLSSLYETEPVGFLDQPRFLNAVCQGETELAPGDLLHFVKEIEQSLGRRPAPLNHPRPVDIDILLYDELTLDSTELTIPHPRMKERAFVLVPLAEIAPDLRLPSEKATVNQLLAQLSREGVRLWSAAPQDYGGKDV